MDEEWRKDFRVVLLAAALAVGVLLLDRSLPLGVAGGVPYVAVVILGWWLHHRNGIFLLAALCSILTIVGFFLSPPGGIIWMVASNGILALSVIWVTALLLAMTKHKADELRKSERRAKAAEQRLRDAIESSSGGFVVYDADDRLVLGNGRWMALYGYSEERVRPGIHYEDLVRLDVELGAMPNTNRERHRGRCRMRSRTSSQGDAPVGSASASASRRSRSSRCSLVSASASSSSAMLSQSSSTSSSRSAAESLKSSSRRAFVMGTSLPPTPSCGKPGPNRH